MYYGGEYGNTLTDAMRNHDLSHHRPARTRAQHIARRMTKAIFLAPYALFAIAAAAAGILCLAHGLGIIS